MMIADEKNVWSLSPCYVCRLVSPSGRLHIEDGLNNGSDFSTFGTDETTMIPDNIMRERWETHTYGRHQDGRQRLCFTQVPDGCDSLDLARRSGARLRVS